MKLNLSPDVTLNLAQEPYTDTGLAVLLAGNQGCGKTNTIAVLCEEFHRNGLPFIIYDPEGDAASLRQLGNDVLVFGPPNPGDEIRRPDYTLDTALRQAGEVINLALKDGYSLIFDLSAPDPDEAEDLPLRAFATLAKTHFALAKQRRTPCLVAIDEAHTLAPQSGATKAQQEAKRVLKNIFTRGRKRGIATVAITQRISYLDKSLVFGSNVKMFGFTDYYPDYETISAYMPSFGFSRMKALQAGEVFLRAKGLLGFTRIRKRYTPHLGQTPPFTARPQPRPDKTRDLQYRAEPASPAVTAAQLSFLPEVSQ
jgi:hypothetical protein